MSEESINLEGKTLNILCVDDELYILQALQRLLRRENYKVFTANSAESGFDILREHDIHLVISDQRMPGMCGTEFMQVVKSVFPKSIRVILSGYAEIGSIMDAINKGEVYRFLTKPWSEDSLRQSIKECLQHYQTTETGELVK